MKIEIDLKDGASGELAKIAAQVGDRKEMLEAMGDTRAGRRAAPSRAVSCHRTPKGTSAKRKAEW